ncbi:MAG TPA: outer membrane beta-barrel protein, partial [Niastella sp.]|nr:outer membrane beta-barrel protein [Niastella sp.]
IPFFNPRIFKGDWMAGGTEAWLTGQYKGMSNSKVNSLTISPDYGYFITNRLAGGLRLSYTKYDQPNQSTSNNYSEFQLAPYLRYYFLPATNKTNILGDISYGFGSEGAGNKESFNYFGVMAGPSFFLNQNTGLEVLGMYKTWGGDAYPDRENEFGLWVGFQNHLRCHERSSWTPQVGKGDWLAGGDLWYSSSSLSGVSNSRTNYFTADPELGYFFRTGLAGGLKLGYSSTKVQSANDAYTNFSAEPFFRYYLLPEKNHVNLFGELGYGFGSEGQGTKESYNFWEVKAGPAFFLSPHTSLGAALNYRSYGGDGYSTKYNQFGISVEYQVHLGGKF